MRHSLTRPLLPVLFALVALAVPASASAAEIHQGNSFVVVPGETIDDDLYVFGGTATVEGTVNGDVVLFGGTSTISGLVTGDVLVLGGSTTINGDIRGSLRAAGGTVNIAGQVDQDVALGAGTLDIAPSARLGRDLLAGVGSARIAGPITRNAFIGSGDVTLAAQVGGDVRAEGGTVRLIDGARVGGKFLYASDRQAEIASGVVVGGGIERGESAYGRDLGAALGGVGGLGGIGALVWLRGLVGIFFLGLTFVLLMPAFTRRSTSVLMQIAGPSLGFGVVLLLGVPILAMLVFALGLLIGGWWLGIVLLFVYALALGVGYVVSAVRMGDLILARVLPRTAHAPALSLLLGILVLGSLSLIPVVGGIVSGAAITAGVGALGLTAINGYRRQRRPVVSPTATGPVIPVPTPA